MCRMFGFKGSGQLAAGLQDALIQAARRDAMNRGISHADGWGGVWVSRSKLSYFRSGEPIFSSVDARGFFDTTVGCMVGLSHARNAAPNEPVRGAYDSHPFSAHLGEDLVFVAHNGWIDKHKLGLEGVDVSKLNDTEAFCLLLEEQYVGGFERTVEAALSRVYEVGANIGALNLLFLRIPRGGEAELYYYSDYSEDKESYYRLYELAQNGGGYAVMSSTVAYMAGLISISSETLSVGVRPAPKKELCRVG
ncbi:MAG: class II glutamine amidotransferase [Thermoprotei archaeon]